VPITTDIFPDGVEALTAALVAERQARQEAEARATGAEAMVAHLKLVIAKLRRERFGPSAERGSQLLDQLELQLEELERVLQKTNSLPRPSALKRRPS
jgi:transposase